MFFKLFLLVALGLVLQKQAIEAADEKKVICYVGTWATYRQGNGKFNIEDVDPFLCTHAVYTFFGVQNNGSLRFTDPWLDLEDGGGLGGIKRFNNLKLKNPKLKTIAAVGGWNEGSEKFSIVANDAKRRQTFAKEAVALLQKFGFDGFDLDWEYPNKRHTLKNDDKTNFILLLKDLKAAFSPHGFSLSVAVAATQAGVEASYDVPAVTDICDFVSVMVYDLNGAWDPATGYNAALYAGPQDVSELQKQLNVKASIDYWKSQGADVSKLILGVPFYGHSFTLVDANNHGVGAPASGPGPAGPYSGEAVVLAYKEICEKMLTEKWTVVFDEVQKVPYAYNDKTWTSYDNAQSIILKAQYAVQQGLGGVMVWSLESDDFSNVCGQGKYPLLNAVKQGLESKPKHKFSSALKNALQRVKNYFRITFF